MSNEMKKPHRLSSNQLGAIHSALGRKEEREEFLKQLSAKTIFAIVDELVELRGDLPVGAFVDDSVCGRCEPYGRAGEVYAREGLYLPCPTCRADAYRD